jgi:hypothetical protein
MNPEGCKPPPLPDRSIRGFKGVCCSILQSHYFGFVFLVPAILMLWIHQQLGLTDAFLMGDRKSANYNLVMVVVFLAGVSACFLHACYLANRSGRWFVLKLVLLGLYWLGFVSLG